MDKHKLEESVTNLRHFQDALDKAAGETDSVKNGDMTKEEQKAEPTFVLFDQIAEASIQILQLPTFLKGFDKIAAVGGDELAQTVAEMLAVAMVHGSYSALTFYDELLKKELDKQFDHFADGINNVSSVAKSHDSTLMVFKKKIGDIEKKLQIDSMINKE